MPRTSPNPPTDHPSRGRPPAAFELPDDQLQQLTAARNAHPKAYVRERAAAVLKVATGLSIPKVARDGLLRPRKPDTVYDWIRRFVAKGVAGLLIRPGRGRKPAFFP